jgi:Protein of unknown function (DUF3048) N-terminal domain/Protein of unknown function (DUF3048) C-terminal domain
VPNTRASVGRHGVGAVLAAVSVCLLAAACGSAPPPNFSVKLVTPAPTQATSPGQGASPPPDAPLTGLPAASASAAAQPAVALPVAGRHTHGLTSADVVFEEISKPLRYVAVFQSRQAADVSPITGTRPADGMILSVLRPLTGYQGGTTSFISVLDNSSVIDLGYPTHPSLYRSHGGDLSTSTTRLEHARRASAPPALFSYRGADSGSTVLASTGEQRPTSVTVRFPDGHSAKWDFDQRADTWDQVSGGPRVRVANLIIQTVRYKTVFLSRKLGQTAPSARVLGRGPVQVFSGNGGTHDQGPGGLSASGQWSKPGLRYVTQYVDGQGFPMALQPGPTWIILAPPHTRVTAVEAS